MDIKKTMYLFVMTEKKTKYVKNVILNLVKNIIYLDIKKHVILLN